MAFFPQLSIVYGQNDADDALSHSTRQQVDIRASKLLFLLKMEMTSEWENIFIQQNI